MDDVFLFLFFSFFLNFETDSTLDLLDALLNRISDCRTTQVEHLISLDH